MFFFRKTSTLLFFSENHVRHYYSYLWLAVLIRHTIFIFYEQTWLDISDEVRRTFSDIRICSVENSGRSP